MIDFKVCYPDANNFSKVIKIKTLKDWQIEYVKLDDDIGYWIAENPFYDNGFELFKNLISTFPIQKDNNHPDNFDPNPFDTIHVPEWIYKDICFLVRDFYLSNNKLSIVDPEIHEWGNVYFKNKSKPISCWRIPHIDYAYGMVANLWFTDHPVEDSCTKLYRYKGKMQNEIYDFQIDENHKMHNRWKSLAENPIRSAEWFNMSDDELDSWGFEYLGSAPTKQGTMTLYKSNVCHSAFVSQQVDFRWSHAFAYSHLSPTTSPTYLRDLFL